MSNVSPLMEWTYKSLMLSPLIDEEIKPLMEWTNFYLKHLRTVV